MNEFMEIVISNLIEIVFAGILLVITTFVAPWFKKVASPFIKNTMVPWLEEKRIYGIVKKFVEAAEKKAENEEFDKKEWVVSLLKKKGIDITPEVEAYIESACKELDMIVDKTVNDLTCK